MPALAAWLATTGLPIAACAEAREPDKFLQQYVPVDQADLAKINAGQPVAKVLGTSEKREVAVCGIVRVDVPIEFFLEQYQDIVNFKKNPAVKQIGKFGFPPRAEDLRQLALEPGELDAFRKCKAGVCRVKMSAGMMARLRNEVDWRSPDRRERSSRLFRDMLASYVRSYTETGNAALMTYDDQDWQTNLANEFSGLLKESPYLLEYAPQFYEYLARFPELRIPCVESFIYWSKEDVGLRFVVSATHVMIYKALRDGRVWYFIVSKQIYASHYFEGSLGLTVLVTRSKESPGSGFWMMYFNRSRADGLRGWLAGVKRSLVLLRLPSSMREHIKLVKERLELRYRAQRASGSVR
jgi:hypothetical protein